MDIDLSDRTVGDNNEHVLIWLYDCTSVGFAKCGVTSAALQPFNDFRMSDFITNTDVLKKDTKVMLNTFCK